MAIGAVSIYKIHPRAQIPIRASDGAVGFDVFAFQELDRQTKKPSGELPITIPPGEARLLGIGVIFALPWGYEIQVRPRSGLATKHDIELSNSPGTIDPDFRGEAGVLLRNRGKEDFIVEEGMRIAQLIFSTVEIPDLSEVQKFEDLPVTRRGAGGFGSTGLLGFGLGTQDFDRAQEKLDKYYINLVLSTAGLSNCARGCEKDQNGKYLRDESDELIGQKRRYGCVIAHEQRVIATGYNAQYPGSQLCAEVGCLRDQQGIASGEQIEVCRAVHAEQMAINAAAKSGVSILGATMYVNAEPCLFCARQIAGAGIESLVILKGGYGPTHGLHIIREAGIKVREISL